LTQIDANNITELCIIPLERVHQLEGIGTWACQASEANPKTDLYQNDV